MHKCIDKIYFRGQMSQNIKCTYEFLVSFVDYSNTVHMSIITIYEIIIKLDTDKRKHPLLLMINNIIISY